MFSFLFKRRSPMQKALARVRRSGESWYSVQLQLMGFTKPGIVTIDEAQEVVATLECLEREPTRFKDPQGIGYLSEDFKNEEVRQHLVAHAQPILARLIERPGIPSELALACLHSVVHLKDSAGIDLFCRMAENGPHADDDQWSIIFAFIEH